MTFESASSDGVLRSAEISRCHTYRWYLSRSWDSLFEDQRHLLWVMLNPSTADGLEDDPTIRRCMRFAAREGAGSMGVVNLFAYRTPDPKVLHTRGANKIGWANDARIARAAAKTDAILLGWGANGDKFPDRVAEVLDLLHRHRQEGVPILHLGLTKSGQPRHPLYLPNDAPTTPWETP